MTDKATHTPLPWAAERDLPHNRMPRVHSSADGSLICECGNMGTTPDQWEANAAFIVRAVNSHHDLIEALREARKIIGGIDDYMKRPSRGDWGEECACCMGELLDDDRKSIAKIDAALKELGR